MIQKIDSNKFSLTILKVTTFSRIRQMDLKHDVYTITNIMILRIVIILFLKLKDIKKLAFSWR